MATLKGSYPFSIEQSRPGVTIFGLPGQGTGSAAYCDVSLTGSMRVWDDGTVSMNVSGNITHPDLIGNDYGVVLVVNPHDWKWTWNPDGVNIPSGGILVANTRVHVPSPRGAFDWRINIRDIELGDLDDFGASREGDDGYAWFGGTGNYTVNDPIAPDPMRIKIPGFMEYLDYFPYAVYSGGSFKSCNRSGGSLSIFKGGSWRDVKNTDAGDGSQAHYWNGSGWAVCPRIGDL